MHVAHVNIAFLCEFLYGLGTMSANGYKTKCILFINHGHSQPCLASIGKRECHCWLICEFSHFKKLIGRDREHETTNQITKKFKISRIHVINHQ